MKGKFKFAEGTELRSMNDSGHPELEKLLMDLPLIARLDAPGTSNISEENMNFVVHYEADEISERTYNITGVKTGNVTGIYSYAVDQESPFAGSFFNWIDSSSHDVEVYFRGTTLRLEFGVVEI
jgi:hypothetical protein